MSTHIPTVDDELKWLALPAETNQQIQDIYMKIVAQRTHALWKLLEIYSNGLSMLEVQLAQGKDDLRIHNQIETIKQEMTQIALEMKGEAGLILQVRKLLYELSS